MPTILTFDRFVFQYPLMAVQFKPPSVEKEVPVQMKNEDWLKAQFAFPLVPTNVEGVYTTQPLPGDLDLKTASDPTLLQHGLFLRRPRAGDDPAIQAAWNQVSERGLRIAAPL